MNQNKTFSGELVLLVLFLICEGFSFPMLRGDFIRGEGVLLRFWRETFINGRKSIYAFSKSRSSYLQIASIHSSVSGMDSCLSRSKVTITDLQIHFTSFVSVSITRWIRWKLLVPILETAVCTAIWSDANICLTKSASMWTTTIPIFSQSTPGHTEAKYSVFPKS